MNGASIAVLAFVAALAAFAVWRNIRKGAPCSCGCSGKDCACGCSGTCACGKKDN